MDEENIYKNLHEELNKRFGTVLPWEDNNILTLEAFQTCFDIYDTKESFEENTEMTFEELLGDTSTLIDGHYVFFNDCNYDWNKGKTRLLLHTPFRRERLCGIKSLP